MADTITILHSPTDGQTFPYKGAVDPTNELNAAHFTDTGVALTTGEKIYGRNAGGSPVSPPPQPNAATISLLQRQIDRITRAYIDAKEAKIAADPAQAWWNAADAQAWAARFPNLISFACPKTVA